MREDNGFTASELWGIAWALGVLAGIAWVRAAFLMDHPHPMSREIAALDPADG